jgi:murein L,D-transpeptidase YafK
LSANKPTAERSARPQKLASRGALDPQERELNAVLLTSPRAIWVQKSERRLTLFENGTAVKSYMTTIGRNENAAKMKSGDWATPEGVYHVRRKNPGSKYHLALHIDYPNAEDAERGLANGLISAQQYNAIVNAVAQGQMPPQDTRLGYYIEIHGGSNRIKEGPDGQPILAGWTRGCVGLRNADIEEIYAWAEMGTPGLITP